MRVPVQQRAIISLSIETCHINGAFVIVITVACGHRCRSYIGFSRFILLNVLAMADDACVLANPTAAVAASVAVAAVTPHVSSCDRPSQTLFSESRAI